MTNADARAASPFFTPLRLPLVAPTTGSRGATVAPGVIELANRIAMAPMTRRKSPDGQVPTSATAAYYARRAAGGVGLIITEGTRFDSSHRADTEDVPALITADQCDAWRRVIDAVREASGGRSKIAVQLWQCGRHGLDPIGPSAIPAPKRGGGFKPVPRAMTRDDIARMCDTFAGAAVLAREVGFDAVEIHGAHTYLLDTFLSRTANQRDDEFGGSFENRCRFPLMVASAVRRAVGREYPVIYRFSQWTFDPGEPDTFASPEDLGLFVRGLAAAGVTMLHASAAEAVAPAFGVSPSDPGARTLAGWARSLSGLPTIAVGRVSVSASMGNDEVVEVRDPAPAAALIERGEADMVAVGRALIANPDWCQTVQEGRWRELRAYSRAMLESLA
jgi:2,4-dienoyl-CoA reductase-like NADH-dependent reductase (Old Yellow Enzyme family)